MRRPRLIAHLAAAGLHMEGSTVASMLGVSGAAIAKAHERGEIIAARIGVVCLDDLLAVRSEAEKLIS